MRETDIPRGCPFSFCLKMQTDTKRLTFLQNNTFVQGKRGRQNFFAILHRLTSKKACINYKEYSGHSLNIPNDIAV